MSVKKIHSNNRMSQIVIHGNTVYLAGQTVTDTSLNFEEQTHYVLNVIEGYLKEAGSSKDQILSATVYLKNIAEDFEKMNAIWDKWIPEGLTPARATVEATLCDPGYLIEIVVVAYKE